MTRRWFSGLGLLLVLGFLGLLGWGMARAGSGTGSPGVNSDGGAVAIQRRPAPNLDLRLFDASAGLWRLKDQAGKKEVLINFWASWCPPCRQEAGMLAQAARDYRPKGVEFVGVNVWDQTDAAKAFIQEFGIDYANGQDENNRAAVDFGVTGIPETFLVDKQGQITIRWVGPMTRSQLDKLIADAKVVR